jgi:hypothetical protein
VGGAGTSSEAPLSTETEITEEELEAILDRERIFHELTSAEPLPTEGVMYDLVLTQHGQNSGILQSLN